MSWFFSIQREITSNTVLDLAYVGNRTNPLLLFANFNQAQPNQPGQTLGLTQRQNTRPFPKFGDITYNWSGGVSHYNKLQVPLPHRFIAWFFFLPSFTPSPTNLNTAGTRAKPPATIHLPPGVFN